MLSRLANGVQGKSTGVVNYPIENAAYLPEVVSTYTGG